MGKNSKERQKQYLEQVRALIVRKPSIGIFEMQEALDRKGLHLDKNTISKYAKKIFIERTKRLNYATLNYFLAGFADEVAQVKTRLWNLASDPMTNPMVKNLALINIIKASDMLIDRMFDAGVFEKQLGKIKTESGLNPETLAIIDQAIGYVVSKGTDKRKDDPSDGQQSGSESAGG